MADKKRRAWRRTGRGRSVDRAISEAFSWLIDAGYEVVEAEKDGPAATYGTSQVLVRTGYHWKDGYATLGIARRREGDPREQPHWSYVDLEEVLALRAPGTSWHSTPEAGRELREVFRSGSDLLHSHAADLVAAENLELLAEIIERRPRLGVPGLDFPTSEPWTSSAEGIWFFTDSKMPEPMASYLERSRSDDPVTRAVAALKMGFLASGASQPDLDQCHVRLHELLHDPDIDVRRAAASALGWWRDRDAMDDLLVLLDGEHTKSPVAAAITFMTIDGSKAERDRVLEALARFGARGPGAAAQVEHLAWRLRNGGKDGYPRHIDVSESQ